MRLAAAHGPRSLLLCCTPLLSLVLTAPRPPAGFNAPLAPTVVLPPAVLIEELSPRAPTAAAQEQQLFDSGGGGDAMEE